MTPVEVLLILIYIVLIAIFVVVRKIYLRMGQIYDPDKPVNQYGENLTDAIQNSIERGQRGINTYHGG